MDSEKNIKSGIVGGTNWECPMCEGTGGYEDAHKPALLTELEELREAVKTTDRLARELVEARIELARLRGSIVVEKSWRKDAEGIAEASNDTVQAAKALLDFVRGRYPEDFIDGGRGFTCPYHITLAEAIAQLESENINHIRNAIEHAREVGFYDAIEDAACDGPGLDSEEK
jgi:hypothetical protein